MQTDCTALANRAIARGAMKRQRVPLILSLALVAMAATSPGPTRQEKFVAELRDADARLAVVANRILIGNAARCQHLMPATGATILALEQYPEVMRPAAARVLGFATPVGIEAIAPGSPAAQAGLRQGDGIVAINDRVMPTTVTGSGSSSNLRDSVERAIAAFPPDRPITFSIMRGGSASAITIMPSKACRSRFEIVPQGRPMAHSDGETIQISSGFLARFGDSALAVIFAHELAHTILGHRERVAAATTGKKQVQREAEREADRLSVHLLAAAGYDPRIAPTFWREHGGAISWLSFGDTVHDSPRKRIAALEDEIGRMELEQRQGN